MDIRVLVIGKRVGYRIERMIHQKELLQTDYIKGVGALTEDVNVLNKYPDRIKSVCVRIK